MRRLGVWAVQAWQAWRVRLAGSAGGGWRARCHGWV